MSRLFELQGNKLFYLFYDSGNRIFDDYSAFFHGRQSRIPPYSFGAEVLFSIRIARHQSQGVEDDSQLDSDTWGEQV